MVRPLSRNTLDQIMKRVLLSSVLVFGLLVAPALLSAQEKPDDTTTKKARPYPLKTCCVSGEKLGEMGKPYTFTYEGQEIQLCCKDCKKTFDKDPAKYMSKIKEAESKEKKG